MEDTSPRYCYQGHQMVIKRNRFTGVQFWGCSKWPECDHTWPIDWPRENDDMVPGWWDQDQGKAW